MDIFPDGSVRLDRGQNVLFGHAGRGEKVPLPQPTKVMGVDKFFTTLYNIYCSKKPHNMACKTKITNILYYITGESYGYFSEML